jgi:hypothetical protein
MLSRLAVVTLINDVLVQPLKYASLHTAYSTTGDFEIVDPSYQRMPLLFGQASTAFPTANANGLIWVPQGVELRFCGLWDRVEFGTFYGMLPLFESAVLPPTPTFSESPGGDIWNPLFPFVIDEPPTTRVRIGRNFYTTGMQVLFWSASYDHSTMTEMVEGAEPMVVVNPTATSIELLDSDGNIRTWSTVGYGYLQAIQPVISPVSAYMNFGLTLSIATPTVAPSYF